MQCSVMKEKAASVGAKIRTVRPLFSPGISPMLMTSLGGRSSQRHSCDLHLSSSGEEGSHVFGLEPSRHDVCTLVFLLIRLLLFVSVDSCTLKRLILDLVSHLTLCSFCRHHADIQCFDGDQLSSEQATRCILKPHDHTVLEHKKHATIDRSPQSMA